METQLDSPEVEEILEKYKQRIYEQLRIYPESSGRPVLSREYQQFKKECLPKQLTFYEKACNISAKLLKLKPDAKKAEAMQESINISHLDITPSGALSFSIFAPLLMAVFTSLVSYAIFEDIFFVFFFLISSLILIPWLGKLPFVIADSWRMKASNQMVLCIFYIVTYMRHTSNLERAIEFAAEHLDPPLSLDLKKVLWDVETEKFESTKESLDYYLETWRNWNTEFIEAFHLIESSLYEPSESRRLTLLDKSLDVILTETYEKMLHYAHNLKNPITTLHMLGIILPILGLVILPLAVNFMAEIKWYHIAVLYNLALPVGVYFLGRTILSKRPTGYGDTDISETNPMIRKYRNVVFNVGGIELKINPMAVAVFAGIVLFLIGMSPLLLHWLDVPDFGFGIEDSSSPCGSRHCLMEYRESKLEAGKLIGPYGIGAGILSLFITAAFAFSFGIYYKLRSKNVIKIRENTKKLEDEFASALFQLGNRLGDGLPAEIAFSKTAEIVKDSFSGRFFSLVSSNISRLGMSVREALFNPTTGAIAFFPSKLIESSMKVLIQSLKKGPKIAAQGMMNISRYVKEMHMVNERLRDLMADVIASMKSQITFLTPFIAGIVIGITSMITTILGSLGAKMAQLPKVAGDSGVATMNIAEMFGDGIPTFHFQIIVGLYVVQIVAILTILSNGIENGADKLAERYSLGVNLIRSTVIYIIVSLAVMLIFNLLAAQIMDVTMNF